MAPPGVLLTRRCCCCWCGGPALRTTELRPRGASQAQPAQPLSAGAFPPGCPPTFSAIKKPGTPPSKPWAPEKGLTQEWRTWPWVSLLRALDCSVGGPSGLLNPTALKSERTVRFLYLLRFPCVVRHVGNILPLCFLLRKENFESAEFRATGLSARWLEKQK